MDKPPLFNKISGAVDRIRSRGVTYGGRLCFLGSSFMAASAFTEGEAGPAAQEERSVVNTGLIFLGGLTVTAGDLVLGRFGDHDLGRQIGGGLYSLGFAFLTAEGALRDGWQDLETGGALIQSAMSAPMLVHHRLGNPDEEQAWVRKIGKAIQHNPEGLMATAGVLGCLMWLRDPDVWKNPVRIASLVMTTAGCVSFLLQKEATETRLQPLEPPGP